MKTLAIALPDEMDVALGCPGDVDLERLLKSLLAVKLYESGRATSGQAAVIAGLSRRAFLLELPKHGVPSVLGGAEEIEAESATL
jgi:predicted HTH domain antitoxin